METVTIEDVKKLTFPARGSHKGQNGRLLIVGGSHLFHAASLWALTVASRIVDLVHYSSVPENNAIVHEEKKEFRNGIVVPRGELGPYIEEDDCILIGPGMTRDHETETITNELFKKYPDKQWVIDAGSLQMMDISLIPQNAILTPHHGEFASLIARAEVASPIFRAARSLAGVRAPSAGISKLSTLPAQTDEEKVKLFAKEFHCIVLLKGEKDIACNPKGECHEITGGNGGMTKGGTGDVLAGLIAALACKNDPFLATIAGSFVNKKAGDELYKTAGPFFNATDLANQIPVTMKELLLP
jgi:NAD(P)H-hydrate epimerase